MREFLWFAFVMVIALVGCSATLGPTLDAQSTLVLAGRAVDRAEAAGAAEADALGYRSARRKLAAARRFLETAPERSRQLAESAAADARLAEAVAHEHRLRAAERRIEEAVARVGQRLAGDDH